jgi:hypothetical protein
MNTRTVTIDIQGKSSGGFETGGDVGNKAI